MWPINKYFSNMCTVLVTQNSKLTAVNTNIGVIKWRRLHNEKLNDLYSSPNTVRVIKSRRMRWAGHVVRVGEERRVYSVLVGKPGGKRPLRRPRRRCVYNIRTDLGEVGYGYIDWIGRAQDRESWRTVVSAVMNLRVP